MEAANSASIESEKEAKQLASGRDVDALEQEARRREHDREQRFRDSFEKLAIGGIWLIALAGMLIGCTWLFHILAPASWHWLDAQAVDKLQNIFTGGVLVSAIGDHWRRRMR